MIVIDNLDDIQPLADSGVITLGNFDGIHLGHKEIISRCVNEAGHINGKSIVVTYDHQSSALFKGNHEFISLNTEKIEILKNLNVDILILIPFSEKIKNLQAEDFLRDILIKKLNTRIIVIGYDHHFGKNREGNIDFLKSRSAELKFDVIQIPPVYYKNRIISSSRIRSDLVIGNIQGVNDQLGSPYIMSGKVVHGDKRGRIIGFPTANVLVSDKKIIPADGVYAGKIDTGSGLFPCVINIGNNPTFDKKKFSIEVHILDYSGTLYDTLVMVLFLCRIRNETRFDGVDQLKHQIQQDINFARDYLKNFE